MSWAKVQPGRKPLMWWYHKVLCEAGWIIRNQISWKMYYKHLNIMCDKYGFNLYGKPGFKKNQYGPADNT